MSEYYELMMSLMHTIKRLDDMRILGIPFKEWDSDLQEQVMSAYVDTRDYEHDLKVSE
jgi:hypothetical protein